MSRKSRRTVRVATPVPVRPPRARSRSGLAALLVTVATTTAAAAAALVYDRPPAPAIEVRSSGAAPTGRTPPSRPPGLAPSPPAAVRPSFAARLVRRDLRLVPPASTVHECIPRPLPWHVDSENRDALRLAAETAPLSVEQRKAVRGAAACPDGQSCDQEVSEMVRATLSPAARAAIYPLLGRSVQNQTYAYPFRFLATDQASLRALLPELTSREFDVLWRLSYLDAGDIVFAELPLLCELVPAERRIPLQRALNASTALSITLPLDQHTDVEELVAYFHRPDLREPLSALAATPGGSSIDLTELLPPLARTHMNRFPEPGDPDVEGNCFWSALNFFRRSPEARLADLAPARAELLSRYRPISAAEATYGDVLTFEHPGGIPIHAAIKVVDDVYFTRNGHLPSRPWILMARAEMVVRYGEGSQHDYRRLGAGPEAAVAGL